MVTFPAAPLLLALEALAATSKGLPAPARFASALLPRAQVGCSGCVPQGASVGDALKMQQASSSWGAAGVCPRGRVWGVH